jgi:di/tricarboxylate transporter
LPGCSKAFIDTLAGLFVLTAIMGQLISNAATALIVIAIGLAAGAFLTLIATPTNLMVMGPGWGAFGDYWKLGLPLLIWFFVVSAFLVPLIWQS